MFSDEDTGMINSSRTYSKVMGMIEEVYGIPAARPSSRGPLIEALQVQMAAAVKEECRRVVEEAAFRIYRLVVQHLPDNPEDGLFVPATEIRINSGGVGVVRLRAFRMDRWREDERKSA